MDEPRISDGSGSALRSYSFLLTQKLVMARSPIFPFNQDKMSVLFVCLFVYLFLPVLLKTGRPQPPRFALCFVVKCSGAWF